MTDIVPRKNDVVFQHRALARSIHSLPMNLRRLVITAMTKVNLDEGMEVAFTLKDAMSALGIKADTRMKAAFRLSCRDALKQTLSLTDEERPGYWRGYSWFSFIEIDEEVDRITMKFNPDLKAYISDFKQGFYFSKFTISDYGKLTSEYSQKLFDLINSRESQADESGFFFVLYSLQELRLLLGVPDSAYPRTPNFKQRVIDYSVKIINDANIGYRVETESLRGRGQAIKSIRFKCWKISRLEPRNITPATDTEKELEFYRTKHKKDFEKLREEFKGQELIDADDDAADNYALKLLREKYHDYQS